MALRVELAGRTDVGCVRSKNEDAWGYDAEAGIYAVCDGMGGQAAGEIASHLSLEAVLDFFRHGRRDGKYPTSLDLVDGLSDRANRLCNAIFRANRMVYDAAGHNPENSGMGSTIVCVLAESEGVSLGHVGDSRIYLVTKDNIEQITRDHSLVQRYVELNLLTREEASVHAQKNVLYRALGQSETLEVDALTRRLPPNAKLMLCSDGLWNLVTEQEIADIVSNHSNPQEACDKLVALANAHGGTDNITVILLRIPAH